LTKDLEHIYAVAEEVIRSSLCAPPRQHIEKLETTLNQSDGLFLLFPCNVLDRLQCCFLENLAGNGDELDKVDEHDDD